MIVFLDTGSEPGGGRQASEAGGRAAPEAGGRWYDALVAALGDGAVGWVGRNLTLADLRAGGTGFTIVGAPLTLPEALALPGTELVAAVVGDPLMRLAARWKDAEADEDNPCHPLWHTFNMREALDLGLAELVDAGTTVSRHLPVADVGDVMATLATLPVVVGFERYPHAFAQALDVILDLPRGTLDGHAFGPRPPVPGIQAVRAGLERAADADLRLIAALDAARGEARVIWTQPARRAAHARRNA